VRSVLASASETTPLCGRGSPEVRLVRLMPVRVEATRPGAVPMMMYFAGPGHT
jgi:hypothetical protein